MIYIAQFFSAFLAALVISKSYSDLKRGQENIVMFIFWGITWIAIAGVAFFPGTIDWLIEKFGGQRTGLGTIFGLGLTFLFFVIYRVYIKADRIEKELSKFVRDLAIKSAEPKKEE